MILYTAYKCLEGSATVEPKILTFSLEIHKIVTIC